MSTLVSLITSAVTFGTVLMYGTLGEILTEKSGNLNLGVEGIMYMGGAFGLAGGGVAVCDYVLMNNEGK